METVERQKVDAKFSISHIGSLLSERNPEILWQTLAELVVDIPSFKDDFELKLIGTVSESVLQSIEENSLNSFLHNLGYVSHAEAIAAQRKSQVLLLLEIDSPATKAIIPGKLFEYMVSGRPILALGPEGADFADILKETNTGIFITYQERQKLKSTLIELYSQFLNGDLKVNAAGLQQYSRKNLTGKLADVILNLDETTKSKTV